jgi:pSer/pThr/pTyr-binding forkhead associated (FHA) protein
MARLILMFNKQVIKEYPLLKESLTIGRKPDNTIVIDNLAVSGSHCRIDWNGSDHLLTDLQSTNGTFVNDKKEVSHKLKHGDNIIVGKHVLLFLDAAREEDAHSKLDQQVDPDQTMILDTVSQRELLAKQTVPAATGGAGEKRGVLSFIDSSRLGEVELKKKLTRLGKSGNSEIKLSGLLMSPTMATISKRPAGYTITFTGGILKLKVNGEIVKESIPLRDFDTIELGSYKFQFYEKEAS